MISAVIMFFVICVICVLCVKTAENGNSAYVYFFGKAELRNTVEIPLSELDQLEVIYRSKNLKVYPIEGDTVIIKEYLLNDKKGAQAQVLYEPIGDGRQKVTVKGGEINNIIIFGFFVEGERIEIYIPKEGLGDLSLQTHSGNITAQEGFSLQT